MLLTPSVEIKKAQSFYMQRMVVAKNTNLEMRCSLEK